MYSQKTRTSLFVVLSAVLFFGLVLFSAERAFPQDLEPPEVNLDLISILPPDPSGMVTVVGQPGAIFDETLPIQFVVTNMNTGNSMGGIVEPDGGFVAILPGSVGDLISLFGFDAAGNEIETNIGEIPEEIPAPTISRTFPSHGIHGTSVVIEGSDFGDSRKDLLMHFAAEGWDIYIPVFEVVQGEMIELRVPWEAPLGMVSFSVLRSGYGETDPIEFEVVELGTLFDYLIADTEGAYEACKVFDPKVERRMLKKLNKIKQAIDQAQDPKKPIENLISFFNEKLAENLIEAEFGESVLANLEAGLLEVTNDLDIDEPEFFDFYFNLSLNDPGDVVHLCGGPFSVFDSSGNHRVLVEVANELGDSQVVFPNADGSFYAAMPGMPGTELTIKALDVFGSESAMIAVIPPAVPDGLPPEVDEELMLAEPPFPVGTEGAVEIWGLSGCLEDQTFPLAYEFTNVDTGEILAGSFYSSRGDFSVTMYGDGNDQFLYRFTDPFGNLQEGEAPVEEEPTTVDTILTKKLAGLFKKRITRNPDGSLKVNTASEKDQSSKKEIETACGRAADEIRKKFGAKTFNGKIKLPDGKEVPVVIGVGGTNSTTGHGDDGTAKSNAPNTFVVAKGGDGADPGGKGGNGGNGKAAANGSGSIAVGLGGKGGNASSPGQPGGTGGKGIGATGKKADNSTAIGGGGQGGQGGPTGTSVGGKYPVGGTGGKGGEGKAVCKGGDNNSAKADGGPGGKGGLAKEPNTRGGRGGEGGPANAKTSQNVPGKNNSASAFGGKGGDGGNFKDGAAGAKPGNGKRGGVGTASGGGEGFKKHPPKPTRGPSGLWGTKQK